MWSVNQKLFPNTYVIQKLFLNTFLNQMIVLGGSTVTSVRLRVRIVQNARLVASAMQLLRLDVGKKLVFLLSVLSEGMSALSEAISPSASLESGRHPRVRMPGSTTGKRAKVKHRLM
jgi:hypothetical protein